MARIAGVDLPREKKVEIGLTYIFGIGRATARRILSDDRRQRRHSASAISTTPTSTRLRQTIEKDRSASKALCAPKSR